MEKISIYPPIKTCTQEEFDKKYAELQKATTAEEILALQKELVPMRRYLHFGSPLK